MARLESSAWPVAAGSATLFALSVLLKSLSWTVAFVVLMSVVAAWSLRAPVITGVVLSLIGWSFLTGFDVNDDGALRLHGWGDVARVCALIGTALAGTAAGRMHDRFHGKVAPEPDVHEELIWAVPHRLVAERPSPITGFIKGPDGDQLSRVAPTASKSAV